MKFITALTFFFLLASQGGLSNAADTAGNTTGDSLPACGVGASKLPFATRRKTTWNRILTEISCYALSK